jgi:hypothetical protein
VGAGAPPDGREIKSQTILCEPALNFWNKMAVMTSTPIGNVLIMRKPEQLLIGEAIQFMGNLYTISGYQATEYVVTELRLTPYLPEPANPPQPLADSAGPLPDSERP